MSLTVSQTTAAIRDRISSSLLLAGLLLVAMATHASAQSPDPQTVINSYRRLDWTGKGTFLEMVLEEPAIVDALGRRRVEACFDTARHLRHVPGLLRRVFK